MILGRSYPNNIFGNSYVTIGNRFLVTIGHMCKKCYEYVTNIVTHMLPMVTYILPNRMVFVTNCYQCYHMLLICY